MAFPFESMSDDKFRGLVYKTMEHPEIAFIMKEMELMGCKVDRRFIQVEECNENIGGGFRVPDGVVLCKNRLQGEDDLKNTIQHELIHAYDHCRSKRLNWQDCEQQACSEIRAAALSGDCSWKMEWLRGKLNALGLLGNQGHFQKCVRRRAQLSISMKEACHGYRSKEAVDKVFQTCFHDTSPFPKGKYP